MIIVFTWNLELSELYDCATDFDTLEKQVAEGMRQLSRQEYRDRLGLRGGRRRTN